MTELLLMLLLFGAGLQHSSSAENEEKSDVKYKGPVVYSNLPPPVLYFPKFPSKPKISDRGSSGDLEDKRVEYVPFPYKDLPLLVYQSDSQPPVHVVEKPPGQDTASPEVATPMMSDGKDQGMNSAYQTGPAIYQMSNNHMQNNQPQFSSVQPANPQAQPNQQYSNNILASPEQHFVGGSPQNQQYISIGVSPIQNQVSTTGLQNMPNDSPPPQMQMPASHFQQQQNPMVNQVQHPMQQNNAQHHNMAQQTNHPQHNSNQQQMTSPQMQYAGQQTTAQRYPQGQYQEQQNVKMSQNTPNAMQVLANPQQIAQQMQAHPQLQLLIQNKLVQQHAQQQQLPLYTEQQGKSRQPQPVQSMMIQMSPETNSQPQQHLGISISTIQQPIMQVNPKQQQTYEEDSSYQVMPQLNHHISQQQQMPQQQQQYVVQQHMSQQQMPQQHMSQQQIPQHVSQQQMPQQHMSQQQMPQHVSQKQMPQQQQQMYSSEEQNTGSNNPQYVSIGVYPLNLPASPDVQNMQQYYNAVMPPQNDQYQNTNDLGSKQANQNLANMNSMALQKQQMLSDSAQMHTNSGYQVISIDLSAIGNQNAAYQTNSLAVHNQQVNPHETMAADQAQSYGGNSYDSPQNRNVQQILIQIPHNLLSEQQSQIQHHVVDQMDAPYTGTAQVANFVEGSNKMSNTHANFPKLNGRKQHRLQARPSFVRPTPAQRVPQRIIHDARGPKFAMNQATYFPHSLNFQKPVDFNDFHISSFALQKPLHNTPSQINSVRLKKYPKNAFHQGHRDHNFERFKNLPQYVKFNNGFGNSPKATNVPPHGGFKNLHPANLGRYKGKSIVPPLHGHPGVYSSSNAYFTSLNPAFTKRPFNRYNPPFSPSVSFEHASSTMTKPRFVMQNPSNIADIHHNPFQSTFAEELLTESSFEMPGIGSKGLSSISHNFTNTLGIRDVALDEIDEFLDPSYEIFGATTTIGEGKKTMDENMDKFLQKVTSDLLTHDIMGGIPKIPPPIHPAYNSMKPLPNAFRVSPHIPPHFYNYFTYPLANFGRPPIIDPRRNRYGKFAHYRYPLIQDHRPIPSSIIAHRGKKRNKGIMSKLSTLRNALLLQKMKSKITPREEVKDEDESRNDDEKDEVLRQPINASPRSTIIKTDRQGLDGISIPLNIEHTLTSRISEDDDEDDDQPRPPIIVYKGVKPPVEIYGSKEDIEKNEEEDSEKSEEPLQMSSTDQQVISYRLSDEDQLPFDGPDGLEYMNIMYSMLPDFIKHSLARRSDLRGSRGKFGDGWHPVKHFEYSSVNEMVDHNISDSKIATNTSSTESLVDSRNSTTSSGETESAIKEDIDELIMLLQKEEKSDLVAH